MNLPNHVPVTDEDVVKSDLLVGVVIDMGISVLCNVISVSEPTDPRTHPCCAVRHQPANIHSCAVTINTFRICRHSFQGSFLVA